MGRVEYTKLDRWQNKKMARHYILRFPFKLPPGYSIDVPKEPQEFSIDGLSWVFESEDKSGYYLLQVKEFDSETACQKYFECVLSSFKWLLLKRNIAIEASRNFEKITYAPDPELAARTLERTMDIAYEGPMHGLANWNSPSVYPSDERIRFARVGTPKLTCATPLKDICINLQEGIDICRKSPAISDEKLQLAFDLFSAYWHESTNNARLLTLVMALEALMTHPTRHSAVVQLLGQWQSEVEQLKNEHAHESDEYHAFESLEHELFHKRTESFRGQVRSLVLESAKFLGRDNPERIAQEAVKVYDQRSKLVHNGSLPASELAKAVHVAKSTIGIVLEARYRGFR